MLSVVHFGGNVLQRLDSLIDDIGNLNSKLILLVGAPRSGKTELLHRFAARRGMSLVNVGIALGRQLLSVPASRRHLYVREGLRKIEDDCVRDGIVLLDNVELLFDQALQLNPLDLLKQEAHARRVVAAWPGKLQNNRLSYATMGHPEYWDYAAEGVVTFNLQ